MRTLTVPWIHDRHTHVSLYGALSGCPSVSGLDHGRALALLRSLPADRLTIVLGWHSGKIAFSPQELAGLPPALVVNHSLHGLALTASARPLVRARDPELAERHTEPGWCEHNLPRLLTLYATSAGLTAEKLDGFMRELESKGVAGAEDMLLTCEEAWRAVAGSRWASRVRFFATPRVFRAFPAEARASTCGLKLFLDGALGARTAALSRPYRDAGRGLLMYSDGELLRELADLHALAKPLALHAIGDLAVGQAVRALAELDRQGVRFPQVRLEHAQFIREDQARRARDLGLVLSMQPNFNSESVDYADRLEPPWREANNPFRMLIDRCGFRPGEDLLLGSDGMPHGIEFALQWGLFPDYPGQRMTLEEMLAGYGARPDAPGASAVQIDDERRSVRLVGRASA
jgi:predicted amidohydrolase YtcJ